MRYEFEVGDYVKLIANKTISSKPIGYIGKVLRTKMFPGFGVCCALDSDDMSWSQFSDLAPATKAEYEAYHKSKPKFKVGDWVKVKPDAKDSSAGRNLPGFILKIGSIGDNYNEKGKYISDYEDSNSYVNNYSHGIYFNELVPATYGEIKQHLLAEASRRGFKPGVYYIMSSDRNRAVINPEFYSSSHSQYNLHCGYGCGLIYNDSTGEWATILPAEKELYGYKVNKTKGSSLINIGCKAISEGEIQGFLNVCEKFSITGVYSEYVKGQSIDLDAIKEALK